MKIADEKAFPRGGQKPGAFVPSKGRLELFHKKFGRKQLKSKPKDKQKPLSGLKAKGKAARVLKQTSAKLVNYKTITEGTLILGCVKEITDFSLKVNLPGRIFGEIPITNISRPYNDVLQKLMDERQLEPHGQLPEMFRLGQYVVTKVMQVEHSESNVKVILTTSPYEIHSNWSHRNVQTGLVMPAAVSSVEDHGYVMDLGISGVRAFLKMKKAQRYEQIWNNGKQLYVGQIVRCLVTKAVSSDTTTTVELSADPETVAEKEIDISKITQQILTPGMLFTATITHVVQSGVQVKFGTSEIGYVHEDHLKEPFSLLKDVSVGASYPARVLYIQPIVKTVHLTLLENVCAAELPSSPFEQLNIGDVLENSKVIRVSSHGVLLNLGHELRGLVSVHHASEQLKRDVERPLVEQLKTVFPPGSKYKCRILGYDYMAQLYSCTLKTSVLKDKLFCVSDCKPGMIVSCYIDTVRKSSIDVTLGSKDRSLVGFVPALHMADVPLKHPEKKFKEGSKHKAKILRVKNNRIWLTLKPSLVSSTLTPLCQYENINRDFQYEGVVVLIGPQGLLVEFYGGVKGWVPTYKLGTDTDQTKRFYVGQTVKCYVTDVDIPNQRMTLSMVPFSETSSSLFVHLGEAYRVEVTSVDTDCLHVQVCDSPEVGVIYAENLTDHPSLSKLLLATYKEGDVLFPAYCFTVQDKLVFSVQQSVVEFFSSELGKKIVSTGVNALQEDVVIPCSVRMVNENGVMLNVPVPGVTKSVWVAQRYVCNAQVNISSLGLVPHQVVMAKLSSVNVENNTFKASTKLSQCWNFNLQTGVSLLESYLLDQKRIMSHLAHENDPLAKHYPGNMVEGVVKTITEIGAVVELSDGIQGVVMPYHYEGLPLKVKRTVQGMVLLVDVVNHCVELTLLPEVMARVNRKQDGLIRGGIGVGVCLRGETMVAKPHQVVVSLKGAGRQQLASIPVRCHLNDFNPVTPLHRLGDVNKIVIEVAGRGIIIGLPKVLIKETANRKRQHKLNLERRAKSSGKERNQVANNRPVETDEVNTSDFEVKYDTGESHNKKSKLSKHHISDNEIDSVLLDSKLHVESVDDGNIRASKKQSKKSKLNANKECDSDLSITENVVPNIETNFQEGGYLLLKKAKRSKALNIPDLIESENSIASVESGKKKKRKKSRDEQNSGDQNTSNTSEMNQDTISITEGHPNKENNGESSKKKMKTSKHSNIFEENVSFFGESNGENKLEAVESEKLKKRKSKDKEKKSISEVPEIINTDDNGISLTEDSVLKDAKKKGKRKSTGQNSLQEQKTLNVSGHDCSQIESDSVANLCIIGSQKIGEELQSESAKGVLGYYKADAKESTKSVEKLKRKKRNSSSEREVESSRTEETGDTKLKPHTLSADIGFVWDAKPDLLPAVARFKTDADTSTDEEGDESQTKKKKKKLTPAEKRELARQEEKRLREIEQQLMDSERNPQSADDFDRLVLASPNNSMLWIKYMAFHLQATEIEKARAVADRALKTISFREEQEKLNVWVALLNLENLYGTKESLDKTLQEAVQMNDAYKVYMQMLQIYVESSKIQEAEKLTQLLVKKFRDNKDTWLQSGEILMKFKHLEKARALMQKALRVLETKDHVEVIMKFALLENKYGEIERAQTLMEHILTSYPKRVDVWSSYVDMLVKSGLLDIARQVLERAVIQKLPIRKMKVLFKKFLQFEEQHGTPEGAEKVRQMALDYVNSAANIEEANE